MNKLKKDKGLRFKKAKGEFSLIQKPQLCKDLQL